MRTFLPFKQNILANILFVAMSISSVFAKAQSGSGSLGNGMKFDNFQLTSGENLKQGAKYLFTNVADNVDAEITIDSLVNGAAINKIDDNSNGTGYKEAFQPAIQSGGVIGMSYAVFTVKFFQQGTTNAVTMPIVNATALDLDGSNTLKEFSQINVGPAGLMNYLVATPDISVLQLLPGNYLGQNILGVERNGIDTSALANMFTARNSNISSFTVKYGTITIVPSNSIRQFSLYMKRFEYPGVLLPVKLTSFNAFLTSNNKVDLKWSTASEMNVSHFGIERSIDGSNFSDAGTVFAYGNTTVESDYMFADNISNIQSSVIYYRLRSVDSDGKTDYSATRIIRVAKQSDKSITILTYPNPVSNELRITIPANWQNKKLVYEVVMLNGQTVKKNETANSSQTETLNVSNLAPGVYFVRVNCGGEVAQQKIIKQ